MNKIKLAYAPTRRSIFSAPDALRYRKLIADKLKEFDVAFVDITDINEEGLLYDEEGRVRMLELFRKEKVDGLFIPHCNFGTEFLAARLAKDLGVPVLLWGPRDERPDENGIRLRDTQCGLFATGKVLRRFQVPFTYLKNCRLEDEAFEKGIRLFLSVCSTVKAFRSTRILQIAPRPYEFFTTMCNEGELLERFNIQLSPIPMPELTAEMKKAERDTEVQDTITYIKQNMEIRIKPEEVEKVAVLKTAMKRLAARYGCNAIAIQCWNALQSEIGIMPCAANALLTEEGIPVVCETDIHGAVTSILMQAAAPEGGKTFFADWTVRHPDNENGELLQHCGPWPISVAGEKPAIDYPLAFDHPGAVSVRAKDGEVTLARFDGDNGEYSLLLGKAKVVPGPFTKGTYAWVEVKDLDRLEEKIVTGPYIHHCTGVYADVEAVLYEACKYIGVKADLYDNNEEEVRARVRGK